MPNLSLFIVNVDVAVIRDGRFLAIVRGEAEEFGASWLVFPGGKLEASSAIQDALELTARREVCEEVGLELDGPITYMESHLFAVDSSPVLDVVMLARSASGQPHPASPDEVAEVRWLTADEFLADPRTQEWTRDSLLLAEGRRSELGW